MRLQESVLIVPHCAAKTLAVLALALAVWPLAALAQVSPVAGAVESQSSPLGGAIRLRQPIPDNPSTMLVAPAAGGVAAPLNAPNQPAARPGEFELFVGLPRFGTDLVNELAASASDFSPVVPPEYIVQSGDELQITIWGSVDADLRLSVDRTGRVTIPRVGPVMVAGVRFADLHDLFTRRVATVFKNFEVSVSLGRLRGVRVYVTGFVQKPGAYAVASLSSVMSAVMRAGGPAASGSFRLIELRREGKLAGSFDLYDLLLRGDRSGDRLVQPDDVIHVLPVGTQVGLRGSVNKQAVYELKPGETLRDLLQMAGGFSPVADRSRVAIERLDERNAQRVVQMPLPSSAQAPLASGDVVRVFSAVESALSVQRQNKRVRIEGEVATPGEFVLPPNSSLSDALRAAGGLTSSAYLYAANFTRESVRLSQQENFDRALRDMETELVRASTTQRVASSEEAATSAVRSAANTRLIEKLRSLQPTGRVVFQLNPQAAELPDILLEDGDRLIVPPQPTTVGVFGSVFNSGTYLFAASRSIGDYLRLAGGATKGADEGSAFVVRANGQVVSSRQQASTWFGRANQIAGIRAEPGDTVFVPEELDKSTFIQNAKDWTQILYQLGIGLASFKVIGAY